VYEREAALPFQRLHRELAVEFLPCLERSTLPLHARLGSSTTGVVVDSSV